MGNSVQFDPVSLEGMLGDLVPVVLLSAERRGMLVRRGVPRGSRRISLFGNKAERKDTASWVCQVRVHVIVHFLEVRPKLSSGHL